MKAVFLCLLLSIAILLQNDVFGQNAIGELRNQTNSKNITATRLIETTESHRGSIYFEPKSPAEELALEKLEQTIKAKAKLYRFNGEVIITYNNRILTQLSLGYANPITYDALETGYRFQLASVSKQFTAAAILELVAQGKLKLNTYFSLYFPEFKFKSVTIEHLLTHSAGLPDYFWYLENTWKSDLGPTNKDVIPLMNRYVKKTEFRPGSRHAYSNTGYVLLALLVEKLTEMPFKDYIAKQYFKPLNMTKTGYLRDGMSLAGYKMGNNSKLYYQIQNSLSNAILGDKGIYTTAWDLNKWFVALKEGKVLSEDWVNRMFYPKGFERNTMSYGMGFKLEWSKFKLLKVYHNGLWEGFRNGIAYFPKKDLHIIVLSHTSVKAKNIFEEQVHMAALATIEKLPPVPSKSILRR